MLNHTVSEDTGHYLSIFLPYFIFQSSEPREASAVSEKPDLMPSRVGGVLCTVLYRSRSILDAKAWTDSGQSSSSRTRLAFFTP